MSAGMTCDLTKFRAALRSVAAASKKPEAEIVNKALKDVAFRAASFTKKTDPKKVKASLERSIGGKGASEGVKIYKNQYGTFSKKTSRSLGAAGNSLLKYLALKALKNKGRSTSNASIEAMMKRIMARRLRGIGGVRAGWIPAITALGGKYRGAKMKPRGSAAKGLTRKAGLFRMAGFIENAVITRQFGKNTETGAGDIPFAVVALRRAVAFVTRDRQLYAERKAGVGRVLKKYSDK